ncbi:DEAD/DEAH box helicase family protein [Thermodesulfovibrionales bacterium]|nr:DEAD/DEAH box helicase family protein [Thermodesulfovibrionales bacterium]
MANQTPEQIARDKIDVMLQQAGWKVQGRKAVDFSAGLGIAVREYPTDIGPADYALFVDRKPLGVIEVKPETEGYRLTVHEAQAEAYAQAQLKYVNNDVLAFVYESTGEITRFTNFRDPKPRARQVFSFHRPETFQEWLTRKKSLRTRIINLPPLEKRGLRDCQIVAIETLEQSFKDNFPRALIQMATGSGKTYTAITFIYRLLKFSYAKRVLFLVDTKNLGEQAEQEFMAYTPSDDNRKFTELYNVQRLKSSYVSKDSQVCICTIQRLYSILKGEELDEKAEEVNPNEMFQPKKPMPVVYNEKIPLEFFDFIVIDECHRSIYNLWRQVLEYFDAFLIGLTATPDKRTFGFFNENTVSEYPHERAVADGVNVGYDVYTIETEITSQGARIEAKEYIDVREKLTRKKRWEQLDEEVTYKGVQLDRDIVNPSQIRNIIRAFKNKLSEIFPGRAEIPKTLIFAKTDSHADDIIEIAREEFAEGNDFCKKITYLSEENPKSILAQFRNSYNPRIAVTVDMIATGTDVKPLECLLFMRDVRSRNYFEQMKGRGTRILGGDDLKKVTPSAKANKTHFVIVNAVAVTKSLKTDSRPLERKPTVPLKDLLGAVLMGVQDEDTFLSLANRLTRMDRQITPAQQNKIKELSGGVPLGAVVNRLLDAHNPDRLEEKAKEIFKEDVDIAPDEKRKKAQDELAKHAQKVFTGTLNEYLENARKSLEQIIDTVNIDKVTFTGWDTQAKEEAENLVNDFKTFLEEHKDEIKALSIYYSQPYRRREVTYQMIKEVFDLINEKKPTLAPLRVWEAYAHIENVNIRSPKSALAALVGLIRRIVGIDKELTDYDTIARRNFRDWVVQAQAGHKHFNKEQMEWLYMIRDHIATSLHIEKDDFDLSPFGERGGLGKLHELFGNETNKLIEELNEVLVV